MPSRQGYFDNSMFNLLLLVLAGGLTVVVARAWMTPLGDYAAPLVAMILLAPPLGLVLVGALIGRWLSITADERAERRMEGLIRDDPDRRE